MKGDHIKYKGSYKYQLCEDYTVQIGILPLTMIITDWIVLASDGWLTIFKGYAWDGPSGPTFDTKDSMRGSLVHDALYQLMRMGLLDICYRPMADKLLHDICEEDGMPKIRADLWREADELFAGGCARSGTEKEIEVAP